MLPNLFAPVKLNVYTLKFGKKNNFFIFFFLKCLLSIYLSTLRWIYLRKMRGYPQFSFWISMTLFNGMIYIVIFWKKNIFPALVSTVLKGRLIDSTAHYPAELSASCQVEFFQRQGCYQIRPLFTLLLTPRNTSVSSKNIFPDPYYCYGRSLAVTTGVKRSCSPAVHWCTPAAPPARKNASYHQWKPVV